MRLRIVGRCIFDDTIQEKIVPLAIGGILLLIFVPLCINSLQRLARHGVALTAGVYLKVLGMSLVGMLIALILWVACIALIGLLISAIGSGFKKIAQRRRELLDK